MKVAVIVSQGLVLTFAIACAEKPAPPPLSTASPSAATSGATPPASTPAPATASPVASVPAPPPAGASATRPIATAEGTIPGTRVEVTELKRSSGGTLTLKFALVNESSGGINVGDISAMLDLHDASYTVGAVHLIDPVGKKKYFVARDSDNKCVCSVFGALQKGARANHWAKFPAPPDDVEKISVVLPNFSPLDDVPISR